MQITGRRDVPSLAMYGLSSAGAGRCSVPSSVEPKRKDALIGAIVLEELDLIVDGTRNEVRPRDPDRIISEIE
jgi:hypothetical protein